MEDDRRGRDKIAQIVQQIRPLFEAVIYSRKAFAGMVELVEAYEALPHEEKVMVALAAGDLNARVTFYGENAAVRAAIERLQDAERFHRRAGEELAQAMKALEQADAVYGEKKE